MKQRRVMANLINKQKKENNSRKSWLSFSVTYHWVFCTRHERVQAVLDTEGGVLTQPKSGSDWCVTLRLPNTRSGGPKPVIRCTQIGLHKTLHQAPTSGHLKDNYRFHNKLLQLLSYLLRTTAKICQYRRTNFLVFCLLPPVFQFPIFTFLRYPCIIMSHEYVTRKTGLCEVS